MRCTKVNGYCESYFSPVWKVECIYSCLSDPRLHKDGSNYRPIAASAGNVYSSYSDFAFSSSINHLQHCKSTEGPNCNAEKNMNTTSQEENGAHSDDLQNGTGFL